VAPYHGDQATSIAADLRITGISHRSGAMLDSRLRFRHAPAMDDPMPIGGRAAIPLADIDVRASRSSGPGGQHANVTASRIEASLDLTSCRGLDPDQRRRLIARLGPRVTAVAQDTRSQSRNRELALSRLQHRLEQALAPVRPRRQTKPTSGSVQRRLEAKRRQSERKRQRRPPNED
jgi:ribosome-associated protein